MTMSDHLNSRIESAQAARREARTQDAWGQYQVDPLKEHTHDMPDLAELPPGVAGVFRRSEPIAAAGPELTVSRSVIRYLESTYHRRFSDLSVGFGTYLSKFSGKTRSTLRRKIRRFERTSGGTIDWQVYSREADFDEFHALAREVSELTYQEKLFDAGIPGDQEFIDCMNALAKANAVRGFILFLDQRPISYLYCPIEKDRVLSRQDLTHSNKHRRCSNLTMRLVQKTITP